VHLELVAVRRDQLAEGVLVTRACLEKQVCVHVVTFVSLLDPLAHRRQQWLKR
jgi:hypothetical protein